MLAAPATGPSINPASTTTSGWRVNGTGVPGIGIVICAAAASASVNPIVQPMVAGFVLRSVVVNDVMSALPFDAQCNGIAATETECGQSRSCVPVLHRIEQRGQYASAAGADRMTERDRAPIDVQAVPLPSELIAVGERLRGECLVGFDEIIMIHRR